MLRVQVEVGENGVAERFDHEVALERRWEEGGEEDETCASPQLASLSEDEERTWERGNNDGVVPHLVVLPLLSLPTTLSHPTAPQLPQLHFPALHLLSRLLVPPHAPLLSIHRFGRAPQDCVGVESEGERRRSGARLPPALGGAEERVVQ